MCERFVCVCTICIDVKLHFTAGGHRGPRGSVANEDTPWVPVKTYLLYNIYIYFYIIYIYIIYIYIFPPLGAYKMQLGGTYILSLLFYMVIVYCDYTCLYYIFFHSSCQFIVGVFACPLHSTSDFVEIVLSKCVIHAGFVTVV